MKIESMTLISKTDFIGYLIIALGVGAIIGMLIS